MIIYKFEIENFNASDGYARIEVKDGKLEIEGEPDPATLSLIEKYGGKRVKAAKASLPKAAEKDGDK